MSKRSEHPQSRHHVIILDEDWEWLEAHYGRYSANKIGTGVAVRKIVHKAISQLKAQWQEGQDGRGQGQASAQEAD